MNQPKIIQPVTSRVLPLRWEQELEHLAKEDSLFKLATLQHKENMLAFVKYESWVQQVYDKLVSICFEGDILKDISSSLSEDMRTIITELLKYKKSLFEILIDCHSYLLHVQEWLMKADKSMALKKYHIADPNIIAGALTQSIVSQENTYIFLLWWIYHGSYLNMNPKLANNPLYAVGYKIRFKFHKNPIITFFRLHDDLPKIDFETTKTWLPFLSQFHFADECLEANGLQSSDYCKFITYCKALRPLLTRLHEIANIEDHDRKRKFLKLLVEKERIIMELTNEINFQQWQTSLKTTESNTIDASAHNAPLGDMIEEKPLEKPILENEQKDVEEIEIVEGDIEGVDGEIWRDERGEIIKTEVPEETTQWKSEEKPEVKEEEELPDREYFVRFGQKLYLRAPHPFGYGFETKLIRDLNVDEVNIVNKDNDNPEKVVRKNFLYHKIPFAVPEGYVLKEIGFLTPKQAEEYEREKLGSPLIDSSVPASQEVEESREVKAVIPDVTNRDLHNILDFRPDLISEYIVETFYRPIIPYVDSPNTFVNFMTINQARANYLAYTLQSWFQKKNPAIIFKEDVPKKLQVALDLTDFSAGSSVRLDTTYFTQSINTHIMSVIKGDFDINRFTNTILSFYKRANYIEDTYALNGTLWENEASLFEHMRDIYNRTHTLQRNDHLYKQITQIITRVVTIMEEVWEKKEWLTFIRKEIEKLLTERNVLLNDNVQHINVYDKIVTFFDSSDYNSSFIVGKIPEIMDSIKVSIRYNRLASELSNLRHDYMSSRTGTMIEKEVNKIFEELTPPTLINEIGVSLFKKLQSSLKKVSIHKASEGRYITDENEKKEVLIQFKKFCENTIYDFAKQINEELFLINTSKTINLIIEDYIELERFITQKETKEIISILKTFKEHFDKFNVHNVFKSTVNFQEFNNQLSKFIKTIPSQAKEFLILYEYTVLLRDTALELSREICTFLQTPFLFDPSGDTWLVSISDLHEEIGHTIARAKLEILSATDEIAYIMASPSVKLLDIRKEFDIQLKNSKASLIPHLMDIQKDLFNIHPNARREESEKTFRDILDATQDNTKHILLVSCQSVNQIIQIYHEEFASIPTHLLPAVLSHISRTSEKINVLIDQIQKNLVSDAGDMKRKSTQTIDDFLTMFHPVIEGLNVPHESMIYSIYNTLIYYERETLKYVKSVGIMYQNTIKTATYPYVPPKGTFENADTILKEIETRILDLLTEEKTLKSKRSSLDETTSQLNFENIAQGLTQQLGGKGPSSMEVFKEWYSNVIMMGEEEFEHLTELCEELMTELFNEIDLVSLNVPFRSELNNKIKLIPAEKRSVEYYWKVGNDEFSPEIKNVLPELEVFNHGRLWTTINDSFDDDTQLQPSSNSEWGQLKDAISALTKDLIYTLSYTIQSSPSSLLKMYYVSFIFYSNVTHVIRVVTPYLLQHSSLSVIRIFSLLDSLWVGLRGFITKMLISIILLIFENKEKIDIENLVRPFRTYPEYRNLDPFPPTEVLDYNLIIPQTIRHILEIVPTESVSIEMNVLINELEQLSKVYNGEDSEFRKEIVEVTLKEPYENETLSEYWIWAWIEGICRENEIIIKLEDIIKRLVPQLENLNFYELRTWVRGTFSLLMPEHSLSNLETHITSIENPKIKEFLSRIVRQNVRLSRSPFPQEDVSLLKKPLNLQIVREQVNVSLHRLINSHIPTNQTTQEWITFIDNASKIVDVLNNRSELRDRNFIHSFLMCMISDIHVQENWFSFLKLLPTLGPRVSSFSKISSLFKLFAFSFKEILKQIETWYDSISFQFILSLLEQFYSQNGLDTFHPLVLSKIYNLIINNIDTFRDTNTPYLVFVDECNELISMLHYYYFFKQYDMIMAKTPFISNPTSVQLMILQIAEYQETLRKNNQQLISHIAAESKNKTTFSELKKVAIIEAEKWKRHEIKQRILSTNIQLHAEIGFRHKEMLKLETNQQTIDKNVEALEEKDSIYFNLKTVKTMTIHLNEIAILTLQKIDLRLRDSISAFNTTSEKNLWTLLEMIETIFPPINDILHNTHKYIRKEDPRNEFTALSMRMLLLEMTQKVIEMNNAINHPENIPRFEPFNIDLSSKLGFSVEIPKKIETFFNTERKTFFKKLHDIFIKIYELQQDLDSSYRELQQQPQLPFGGGVNEHYGSIQNRFMLELEKIRDTVWSFNEKSIPFLSKSLDMRINYLDQMLKDWKNLADSVTYWQRSEQLETLTEDYLLQLSVTLNTRPGSTLKRAETQKRLIELLEIQGDERFDNIYIPVLEGLLSEIITL